jgi:hypothetical protein
MRSEAMTSRAATSSDTGAIRHSGATSRSPRDLAA